MYIKINMFWFVTYLSINFYCCILSYNIKEPLLTLLYLKELKSMFNKTTGSTQIANLVSEYQVCKYLCACNSSLDINFH